MEKIGRNKQTPKINEKKEPEVLSLLDKTVQPHQQPRSFTQEQIEIFPEFYALLRDIDARFEHVETQQSKIITLLKQKVHLDELEAEVMDLLKKKMEKG